MLCRSFRRNQARVSSQGEEFEAAVDESMAAADLALQDASVLADATNGREAALCGAGRGCVGGER